MILQTIIFLLGFTGWDVWEEFLVDELNPFSDLLFLRLKNLSISDTPESFDEQKLQIICQRHRQITAGKRKPLEKTVLKLPLLKLGGACEAKRPKLIIFKKVSIENTQWLNPAI